MAASLKSLNAGKKEKNAEAVENPLLTTYNHFSSIKADFNVTLVIINNYFEVPQSCLRVCLPVESLTIADVWVPPGESQ